MALLSFAVLFSAKHSVSGVCVGCNPLSSSPSLLSSYGFKNFASEKQLEATYSAVKQEI